MMIKRLLHGQRRFLAINGKGKSKTKSNHPPSGTEYLFGQTPIAQALIERRRTFRQLLYVASNSLDDGIEGRGKKTKESSLSNWTQRILDLAAEVHLNPTPVAPSVIDSLAQGQRHQGIALLASNLKAEARLKGLGRVEDHLVNDSNELSYAGRITDKETVPFTFVQTERRPFPVWVVLDRIMDPRNLGAILRSCHFFQVDGVVVTESDSAPFSAVASSASAGALERMRLYETTNVAKFLRESALDGWRVYGTHLHPTTASSTVYTSQISDPLSDLLSQPVILVLGNEGTGMSKPAVAQCHNQLIIGHPPAKPTDKDASLLDLDSLNVSVSAGILLHFLLG